MVTTKAVITGSKTGRARLSATKNRMTNMPMVGDVSGLAPGRRQRLDGPRLLVCQRQTAPLTAIEWDLPLPRVTAVHDAG